MTCIISSVITDQYRIWLLLPGFVTHLVNYDWLALKEAPGEKKGEYFTES